MVSLEGNFLFIFVKLDNWKSYTGKNPKLTWIYYWTDHCESLSFEAESLVS